MWNHTQKQKITFNVTRQNDKLLRIHKRMYKILWGVYSGETQVVQLCGRNPNSKTKYTDIILI